MVAGEQDVEGKVVKEVMADPGVHEARMDRTVQVMVLVKVAKVERLVRVDRMVAEDLGRYIVITEIIRNIEI